MTPSTARRLSRTLVALTLVLTVVAVVLAATIPHNPGGSVIADLIVVLAAVGYGILGSLIVSGQPRNTIGWGFVGVGVIAGVWSSGVQVAVVILRATPSAPLGLAIAWVTDWIWLLPPLAIPWLFLLFPDGHLPAARWRPVGWALGIASVGAISAYSLTPDPTLNNLLDYGLRIPNPVSIGFAGWNGVQAASTITIIVCAIASAFALRGRSKRSTPEVHQQIRWLTSVATVAGGFLAFLFAVTILSPFLPRDAPIFPAILLLLVFTLVFGIPVAAGVAILRYRLWSLDVVVKKTVVVISLTALMLAPAALVLWIGSRLVITGTSNSAVVMIGGIAVGVLALPLLRLSRRIATRFAYGRRATPYEVLARFSGRVGDTYSDDSVLPRMARVLADGTGATSARVLLRVGPDLREAAAFGEPDGPETVVPVIDRGDDLGALALTMSPSDPMNPSKERLTADLAAQAGPVLRNVQLVEELRASRQRLVAAQDAERRKLERNLHDGAQQQLVALTVQLRLAERSVGEPERQRELLARLTSLSNDALEDLRDLARGIYPPLLADKGLGAALASQARKAVVPTSVESDGVGRYDQDVEAAVYFCALEALNNVAKYADATQATIGIGASADVLSFTVSDDGKGFDVADHATGTGLQGMRDRLDAIGGTFAVTSGPGVGTTIEGRIPARPIEQVIPTSTTSTPTSARREGFEPPTS